MRFAIVRIGLFILFLCAGYGILYSQDKDHTNASQLDLYRHYTGTIGGRPVVLDLRYGHNEVMSLLYHGYGHGICYYPGTGEMVRLVIADAGLTDLPEGATEFSAIDDLDDAPPSEYYKKSRPKWVFKVTGTKLEGKRYDAVGGAEEIILAEDYSNSYPMDVIRHVDEQAVDITGRLSCLVQVFVQAAKPSAGVYSMDADFIEHSLSKFLGTNKSGGTWERQVKNYARNCFREFDVFKASLSEDYRQKTTACRFWRDVKIFPEYNEKGFLVFRARSQFNKGAEFMDTTRILCLDVKEKKELQLNDMVNVDSSRISALIEKEVKRRFKIANDVSLTSYNKDGADPFKRTHFIKDKIRVTAHVMITHYGLVFYYRRHEIANKELDVFISYEQLKGLLKPDFKKRMNL